MKNLAIFELYPNVKTVDENQDGTCVCLDENKNEVSIDMSAVNAKATELQTAKETEEQAKANAQASGNQKLLDLGLSQAEATALTGYTPPVAE